MISSAARNIRAYDENSIVSGTVQGHVRHIDVPAEYSDFVSGKLVQINFLLGEITRVQREMDRLDRSRKKTRQIVWLTRRWPSG